MPNKNISKPDWELALLELDKTAFCRVELRCDEYTVSFRNEIDAVKRQSKVVCFVNAEIRGEWTDKDSDIGKKFYSPCCKSICMKVLNYFYKTNNTKAAMEYRQECAVPTHYSPFFKNARAVIKKLKSTCNDITLVSC